MFTSFLIQAMFSSAYADNTTDTIISQGAVPYFNAQAFRPAVDSYQFMWINDTSMGKSGTFNYRSTFSYASKPMVYEDFQGIRTDLLSSVTQMDVSAGFTNNRIRYALTAPVILHATGEAVDPNNSSLNLGLGEVMADVKMQLLDRNHHRLGMAVTGRSSLPTNTLNFPLGTPGWMFELEGSMDAHLGMSTLAVNVGHRHQPTVVTEGVDWGSQIYSRVGFGHPFHHDKKSGIALEYNVAALYSQMDGDGLAMEGMLSGWYVIHELYQLRLGLSKGLSSAMTTPDWRAVASVSFLHKTDRDSDKDGVLDHMDICPSVSEDMDGFQDDDGCPEPTTVNVLLMDHLGNEVRDAHWKTSDGKHKGPGHSSFQSFAGSYEIDVDDTRYKFEPVTVNVLDQEEQDIVIELDLILGGLEVITEDQSGNVIKDATWTIDGVRGAALRPVGSITSVAPGTHDVIIYAPGYKKVTVPVHIEADKLDLVHIKLQKELVTRELELLEKIYFKTASHEIDEKSHGLLDEVAEVFLHHPEIEHVHIEGHTDSQGKDAYNKQLSQDRADEVRKYLIAKGVEADRMDAIGYGEEKPIDSNDTEAGRANNRRVIFNIQERFGSEFDRSKADMNNGEAVPQIESQQKVQQEEPVKVEEQQQDIAPEKLQQLQENPQ